MKLAVFDNHRVGLVEGDELYDVTDVVPGASAAWPPVYMTRLIVDWAEMRPKLLEARETACRLSRGEVRLRSPMPFTGNIVAAPANYRKHVGELGERGIVKAGNTPDQIGFFLKATSSLVGPDDAIELPRGSMRRFDHESELAVIIGRTARNVRREQALNYIFGYSCLIDVSMRLEPGQVAEERVTRKSFDTFTPLGPWIVTADEIPDPQELSNQLWVNDQLRQDANTRDMSVNVAGLIELITSVMTLQPGDVIATGTPEGVGPIKAGDRVRIAIEKVGDMTIKVRETEEQSPRVF
ncbi:fumarylacetoacetate hydrolase family protein [Roseomonas chloroacetimidivorans]|uniref:fumarylacetoacetate hydrolase family protein n=1 Tax=Roseomonas chloroacetimidivorans TaxID=1766656 RepID=UPI003C75F4B3